VPARRGLRGPPLALGVHLEHGPEYSRLGLDQAAVDRLARFGDLLHEAKTNVTAIREPESIERFHFLDSLALLGIEEAVSATSLVDLGAGAGLPALVLAVALPDTMVTAVESVHKKCHFMEKVAAELGLTNVNVVCARAEDFGHSSARESFEVATARALASLAVVLEYALPLVRVGGLVVAMKGAMSDQERTAGENAAGILGGRVAGRERVRPFAEAENRWLYLVDKVDHTPDRFPRKPGVPAKRPLGGVGSEGENA
jgi:16S rRNA (guanine527-N7)-methyltransferase